MGSETKLDKAVEWLREELGIEKLGERSMPEVTGVHGSRSG
jgi:hypothetical protein